MVDILHEITIAAPAAPVFDAVTSERGLKSWWTDDVRAEPKSGTVADYLRQSLTIAGWVAMWRPMEIYLYDWWPIKRLRRNYSRLSEMPIEVVRMVKKEPTA